MTKTRTRILVLILALAWAALPAAWAGTTNSPGLPGEAPAPPAAPDDPFGNWTEHFDIYATGSQMHGQGGWKGWGNVAGAGALTSSTQARSPLNSVDTLGATDLVHEYVGYSGGVWTYTAWQYIPTGTTGDAYFILLNSYDDAGTTNNWSTQVCFDQATNTVVDDVAANCTGPGPIAIVHDQWVEIRVVIDLDANTQTFYYNGTQLYTDSWTEHISGGGALNFGAVDLFANGSSSVFYDDISLSNLPFSDGFESGDTREWHSTVP